MKPIIAITTGDSNGVGYEVIIKSLLNGYVFEVMRPVIYGNAAVAKQHIHTLGEEYRNITWNVIDTPEQAKDGRLNLITCYTDDMPVQLGTPTAEANKAAKASLERACRDLKAGKVQGIVTAPINKEALNSGHTEYLEKFFNDANNPKTSLMMLCSGNLRVALVCNHVSVAEIPAQITEERIMQKLTILNNSLKRDFGLEKPRIAVLALNPHAGDQGLMGKEEQQIIVPAIEKAKEQGIWAFGPYASDGFFGTGHFTHFDAVLAMYHDQGLIPFKTLDMTGVNFTAGLDVVRTSPDHGTGYDIAGMGIKCQHGDAGVAYAEFVLQTLVQHGEFLLYALLRDLGSDLGDGRMVAYQCHFHPFAHQHHERLVVLAKQVGQVLGMTAES